MSPPDDDERLRLLGEIAAETAHELRNALMAIAASTFVAKASPEKVPAQLDRIARATAGAQRLVDDMLDLARGEALGREELPVHAVLEAARDAAGERAAHVDLQCATDLRFPLHPRLFARALAALVDNAIAVATKAPTVTLRAAVEGDRLVVDVTDDGPGVPTELAGKIFEPHVTGRAGGTGLGLAMAARIARAHGGDVTLLTTAPEGAHFRFDVGRR